MSAQPSSWLARVLTAAAVLLWAVLTLSSAWEWPAFVLLAVAWAAAVSVDLVHHELPDRHTLRAFPAFLVLLLPAVAVHGEWGRWGMALLAGLLTGLVLLALALINPSGLGVGDVKLGLSTGAALGWVGVGWAGVRLALVGTVTAFVLFALFGVLLLLVRRASRGTDIAFGPFMVAGVLLAPTVAGFLGWGVG